MKSTLEGVRSLAVSVNKSCTSVQRRVILILGVRVTVLIATSQQSQEISREHNENCHIFLLIHTGNVNIGVDNVPQDTLDETSKARKDILSTNEMINANFLVELQETISTLRREATRSVEIATEYSEKYNKHNGTHYDVKPTVQL